MFRFTTWVCFLLGVLPSIVWAQQDSPNKPLGVVSDKPSAEAAKLFEKALTLAEADAKPAEVIDQLKLSLQAGLPNPSRALVEPALARIRKDPAARRLLRKLLSGYARESSVTMVADDEAGKKAKLELELVDKKSGKPLAGAQFYAYHTDDQGDYAPEADSPGGNSDNPRLFVFAKSDEQGRIAIQTILPAPYRGTDGVRHVHFHVDRDDGSHFGSGIYLDMDPSLDEELKQDAERGVVVLAKPELDGDLYVIRARVLVPQR